ncbi:spondin-1-like isoform X2 [Eriocheir sinensis]|uniref:spondin-1-like isoform X2 n=1 Tax=Eriocheir sinensis TaxID=95602 RepID=UPI0021C8BB4B|nr:spondin-1-like isoform X2 [Eriocheir sinensis]
MSHGPQYVLFHAGEPASPALKSFAETGRSDLIDQGAQAENGVLDAFNTPPITQGVGVVTAQFFVDGNHSRVSLVSKIVPSPDWFVGVDSFDLCEDGNWVDNVKIQVDPLDAGTDNGLTFTSPDWPTTPPERIFRITADYPSHPAHSFNYPTLKHLPRIATFTITKEKEYTLRKPMDVSDPASYNVVKQEDIAYKHYGDQSRVAFLATRSFSTTTTTTTTPPSPTTADTPSTTTDTPTQDTPAPRRRGNPRRTPTGRPWPTGVTEPGIHNALTNFLPPTRTGGPVRRVSIMSNSVEDEGRAGRGRGRAEDLEEEDEDEEEEEEEVTRVEGGGDKFGVSRGHHGPVAQNRIPPGNAMAVIDDIVKNYQKEQRKKRRKQRRKQRREERRRRKGLKKIRPPRDCRVSEWSGWSTCSKTCGIGEQTRARIIVKHARRGGKVCPVLEETTWCGSARACPNKIYFNWT